jgi:hypothetical protein
LQELNSEYVNVKVIKGPIQIKECFTNYDVIVFTDFYDLEFLKEANKYCRNQGKAFLYGGILGLYGFVF